jgi:hypothetical protein
MTLIIRLITDKVPEAFAVFDLIMKDGTKIRTLGVLDKVEKVKVLYLYNDREDIKTYDIEKVEYIGSECEPVFNEDGHAFLYSFNVEVNDPCAIKRNAKLVLVYSDGTRKEICGRYAGISVYYVEYKSCIDADIDKLSSVVLVSMGFRPN